VATDARFLTLRDRAYALLVAQSNVSEQALLEHVYGGVAPPALRAQLVAPLRGDPRFEQSVDGSWRLIRGIDHSADVREYTALALAATGPSPARGRIVCVAALSVSEGAVVERFMATVRPDRRVPRYVADRLGLDPAVLDSLRPFGDVLDSLVRFLGARPLVAQDAALTWAFLDAEARRAERVLQELALIDINALANRLLLLSGKPTLGRVAAQLGVSTVRIEAPEEEARILVHVANRVLALAHEQLIDPFSAASSQQPLRQTATARALPDRPGVYTMRDADERPVYVGKARRLQSRVAAYVHRPLGATRRLEGLVGSVESVLPVECETDLEALVLEDREIRRLEPRFNTVRQSRAPRLWIRLPPSPARPRAALRRLELAVDRESPGEYVGPFRNQTTAEQARVLAREVFRLDALRRTDPFAYDATLAQAWAFLRGESQVAERLARQRSTRLLRKVLAFDVAGLLLPEDPHSARYAILRPTTSGIEGFVLDRGVCVGWHRLEDAMLAPEFTTALLDAHEARTTPEDVAVVLRWFGSQRPPACLLALPLDPQAASDVVQDAALALWEARPANLDDALDPLSDAALGAGEVGG
jgi:DNA polymerase III epsilon subunit-like protein